jgi:hypothetical protein
MTRAGPPAPIIAATDLSPTEAVIAADGRSRASGGSGRHRTASPVLVLRGDVVS